MKPDHWDRASEIFHAALECADESDRMALVDERCADDLTLRDEVLSLLKAHEEGADFLENTPTEDLDQLVSMQLGERWIGARIGAWRIESLIHQGGMGAVYRVERVASDYHQTAALKLIRFGLETRELIERFGRERQVLAQLEHPGIARLLDGGTTESGLPYLVMEYVDGLPIDRYCDTQRLDIAARIRLFEQVCAAVHHAHQKLVIHRDLKPSNILVSADGMPKLLDFGIAKLLSDEALGADATITRQRILTPSNSSPEKFTGGPTTTATDVYALGILLYRLLCGSRPYRIDSDTSYARVAELICRETPTRPSQQLALHEQAGAIAEQRGLTADKLRRRLNGDLDTIVMKALRKEPERRYSSVEAMAHDLERYRAGLPVTARPDSLSYRAGKFCLRHWKGLAATSVAFAALVICLGVALWQADQARSERDRAHLINEFLQTILIEADPYEAGAEATVRDVLRSADERVSERFSGQPAIEAPLRYTIGYTQLSLMELNASLENLNRADQLYRELYGDDDDRTLLTQAYIAWIDYRRGQYDAAEAAYRALLDQLGPRHEHATRATIHNDFGIVLGEMERWDEALEHQRHALEIWLEHEPDRPEIGVAYNNIAYNLHGLGRLDEAREWYERALEHQRRQAPSGISVDLAYNLNNFGVLLRDLGQPEQALPYYRESLDMRIATLGAEHAFTGFGHLNLGRLLLELEQIDAARAELEAALRISQATLQPDQLQVLIARASLARADFLRGDEDGVIETLADVHERMIAIDAPLTFREQTGEWLEQAQQAAPMDAASLD